ncbi:MAG: DUF3991 and TOPRIM domain-containing protein [Desulfobacterales bacterium]|nr:DUF3991 and TOPRIM domain-containing protein [Desulfobacterales bacterium]
MDEELKKLKQIDLVNYAIAQGYVIRKDKSVEKSIFLEKNGDKIVVNKIKNIYFSVVNTNDNGNIISFIQKRKGLNLGEIRKELRPYLTIFFSPTSPKKFESKKKSVFLPPPFVKDNLKFVINYLVNERKIDFDLLNRLTLKGMLYADNKCNCVFLMVNKNGIVGAELRGIFGGEFRGLAKGSSRDDGFFQISGTGSYVLVESAIDALSYKQIFNTDMHIISTAGVRFNPPYIDILLEKREVICAYDNDKKGKEAFKALITNYPSIKRHEPIKKDWNEMLTLGLVGEKK